MSLRRSFALMLAAPALALPRVAAAQQPTPARVLVIVHANLIDGARGAFATDASIVVRDGKIAEIATASFTPPPGAEVIDARGRWVLPGLIDVHTHVSSLASARRALESGVTTIRSASVAYFQDVALREAVKSGAVAGPDVVATGVFVSPELGESVLGDAHLARFRGGVTSEEALRDRLMPEIEKALATPLATPVAAVEAEPAG